MVGKGTLVPISSLNLHLVAVQETKLSSLRVRTFLSVIETCWICSPAELSFKAVADLLWCLEAVGEWPDEVVKSYEAMILKASGAHAHKISAPSLFWMLSTAFGPKEWC